MKYKIYSKITGHNDYDTKLFLHNTHNDRAVYLYVYDNFDYFAMCLEDPNLDGFWLLKGRVSTGTIYLEDYEVVEEFDNIQDSEIISNHLLIQELKK